LFVAVAGVLLTFTILEMSKHLGKEKAAGAQEMDRPTFLGKVTPPKKSVPGHSGSAVIPRLPIPRSIDPSLFPLEAKVATQLSRNMNEGAVFSLRAQGGKPQLRIWVRGGAESAVARRIISRFSPPLHYHIFDLSQVEASAAILAQLSGLSLRVRIEPEGVAFWSGYLQHDKMWHDFFPHIVRELPIIRNHHCKIVFGNQLVKILQKELHQRGLKVQPVASTSSVLLVGSLPKEQKEEWDSWMTKAYERYASQVPIIDKVNSSVVAGVASRDFFPSRIVGISGAAGPWITLADGSKFFQGAKLKDGYVLEEITSSMLLLSGPEGALELHLSMLD
jgi:type III secretion system YscD/HrpQ family protein